MPPELFSRICQHLFGDPWARRAGREVMTPILETAAAALALVYLICVALS